MATTDLLSDGTWNGKLVSDGWRHGGTGQGVVTDPSTGAELGQVGLADTADVDRAVQRAAVAGQQWARTPYHERAAVLRRAGDLWQQHASEIQRWLIAEAGSIPPKAAMETDVAAQECFEAAALASAPQGELLPSAQNRLSMARKVPVGVAGVISPFNFPLILSVRSVAPALALGNAVVLKPDPRTAVSGGVSIVRIFEEAGLPDGLLQFLPGGVEVGESLVTHPLVPVISFTGSTAAGRRVGELGARHLKRVHLELGGNSALVILDDADLDTAVGLGAWGSFLHSGQICMTAGRHLVHESLAEEYVQRLAAKARALRVGNPAEDQVALGPIIDASQRDKIHSLVTSTVEAGATLAAGGDYTDLFYRPTVLSGVSPNMPAYAQEVFGPVAPVLPFETVDEAASLARDSAYGLSLGIATRDVAKGLALAERIPTGIVHINDQTVSDEAVAPFGGIGDSGTGGRFGGAAANIDAFTDTRWITVRGEAPDYPF